MVDSLLKARVVLGDERFNKVVNRFYWQESPYTIPYRRLSNCVKALRREYMK